MKTWFITGASRGLGLAITTETLRRGDRVVATARRPEAIRRALSPELSGNQNLLTLRLDVTDPDQAAAAAQAATRAFGRIDILVNNAGFGQLGAVEEVSDAQVRTMFDVNLFGLLNVTRAVLPTMRAQRSGRIINLSSIAGVSANPGWGTYAASKHAVEAVNEALAAELAPLGITSIAVAPSAFRTGFLAPASLRSAGSIIPDYDSTVGPIRAWARNTHGGQAGDPVRVAAALVDLAETENPPLRLALGAEAVTRTQARIDRMQQELAAWRQVSLSTDRGAPEPVQDRP